MPSAKPDRAEIDELRSRRGVRYTEPNPRFFASLHESCRAATEDGYVTPERAVRLLQQLQSDPVVGAIYPNNVLVDILRGATAPGAWSLDVEHDLLHILFSLCLGYESPELERRQLGTQISIEDGIVVTSNFSRTYGPRPPADLSLVLTYAKLKSAAWQSALISGHIDSIRTVDLRDRFIGFTGKFRFGTREACFNAARQLGGVPCDPAPHLDYFFVSEDLERESGLSSKLSAAIYYRRLYGNPLILPERVWEGCIGSS